MIEIIIGIACFAIVVSVIVVNVINRKKGKCCSGDCSSCSSCKTNKK